MKRLLFSPFTLLMLLFLLPSCVNDDYDDCHNGVRVYFSYDLPSPHDVLSTGISRINLLVFDESGLFLGEWVDEDVILTEDYYIFLPLEEGNYRFVAYGGLTTPYALTPSSLMSGKTSFEDMTMNLLCRSDGAVTNSLGRLFFGEYREAKVVPSKVANEFVVPLIENTNRINVTVEGLMDLDTAYRLRIDDTNGDYTLDNNFATKRKLFYTTLCGKNESSSNLKGSFTVLRLKRDRKDAVLSFREETSNKMLYEGNLIDLILKLESKIGLIDFDKTHDFDIILRFSTNMDVTISINGWELTEQSGPLG